MEHVVRGKLKLKAGKLKVAAHDDKKLRKKMSKKKKKTKSTSEDPEEETEARDSGEIVLVSDRTPAQRRYEELRAKREAEEIDKVASKTYRERVEELNQYLGKLTEHHDIPRVSAAGNG